MVPVAVQGASSSTNGAVPAKVARIAFDHLGAQARCAPDFRGSAPARAASISTAVTCAPARRQLHGLAARRGAKIDHAFARDIAQQRDRQGRGRVLHPPVAFGKAGQVFDAAFHPPPGATSRTGLGSRDAPRRRFSARCRAALRWPCACGDRARDVLAILRAPARPQPVGRVEPRRVQAGTHAFAFARDPAQHGVDQRI